MNRQYIGARYVPKFYEGSSGTDWDSGAIYEPLTIVTYLGNSYTSKKPVPSSVGNPLDNPDYWAATGNYNAQVEEYRQEVAACAAIVDEIKYKDLQVFTPEDFGAVGDGATDDYNAFSAMLTAVGNGNAIIRLKPAASYLLSDELDISNMTNLILEGNYAKLIKPRDNLKTTLFGHYCTNVIIKNVVFDGNRPATNPSEDWPHNMNVACVVSISKNVHVMGCHFIDHYYGVCIITASQHEGVQSYGLNGSVTGCYFKNCGSDIDLYGKPAMLIMGNTSYDCTGNSIQIEPVGAISPNVFDYTLQPDVDSLSVATYVCNNAIINCKHDAAIRIFAGCEELFITGNTIENYYYGIVLNGETNRNIIISGNAINHTVATGAGSTRPWIQDGSGISVWKAGDNVRIENNVVTDAITGIFLTSAKNVTVQNNSVSDCIRSGICSYLSDGSIIDGNTITDCCRSDSWVSNSSIVIYSGENIVIKGNVARNTDKYTQHEAYMICYQESPKVIEIDNIAFGIPNILYGPTVTYLTSVVRFNGQ